MQFQKYLESRNNSNYFLYQYKIESIQIYSEKLESIGYIAVTVSIDSKNKHRIVLKFTNGFIEDIIDLIDGAPAEEEIKNILQKLLTDDDNLYLIRLTRIALGNDLIIKQLKAMKTAVFGIDSKKWREIVSQVEGEELDLLLAEGLSF